MYLSGGRRAATGRREAIHPTRHRSAGEGHQRLRASEPAAPSAGQDDAEDTLGGTPHAATLPIPVCTLNPGNPTCTLNRGNPVRPRRLIVNFPP